VSDLGVLGSTKQDSRFMRVAAPRKRRVKLTRDEEFKRLFYSVDRVHAYT